MSLFQTSQFSLPVAVCFSIVLLSQLAQAQDQKFNVTLNNQYISQLKEYGYLQSTVKDDQKREQIGLIALQFEATKDKPPVDLTPGISVKGDEATIVIDNRLLEQIKGQPVHIQVSKEAIGFKNLYLVYDVPPPLSNVDTINDANGNPLDVMYLKLDDAQDIAGGIEGLAQLELMTKFGKVEIPMNEVAGIRLHIDNEDAAIVVMTNGDSVTGVPNLKNLTMITDWGKAEIETKFIQSLTATAASIFSKQTTDFGPRWVLDTGNSIAPSAPPVK